MWIWIYQCLYLSLLALKEPLLGENILSLFFFSPCWMAQIDPTKKWVKHYLRVPNQQAGLIYTPCFLMTKEWVSVWFNISYIFFYMAHKAGVYSVIRYYGWNFGCKFSRILWYCSRNIFGNQCKNMVLNVFSLGNGDPNC